VSSGILTLTQKGREALKKPSADLSPLCRNILIQVDGKKSIEDLQLMFRGLKGLDESLQRLMSGAYVQASLDCRDFIKLQSEKMLGPKAMTLIKKIDELYAKYDDTCWDHLDELYKTARLFYGEVVADNLRSEITKILTESKKKG
jgi:hypothetical protein